VHIAFEYQHVPRRTCLSLGPYTDTQRPNEHRVLALRAHTGTQDDHQWTVSFQVTSPLTQIYQITRSICPAPNTSNMYIGLLQPHPRIRTHFIHSPTHWTEIEEKTRGYTHSLQSLTYDLCALARDRKQAENMSMYSPLPPRNRQNITGQERGDGLVNMGFCESRRALGSPSKTLDGMAHVFFCFGTAPTLVRGPGLVLRLAVYKLEKRAMVPSRPSLRR
jgi:hypothetical protein